MIDRVSVSHPSRAVQTMYLKTAGALTNSTQQKVWQRLGVAAGAVISTYSSQYTLLSVVSGQLPVNILSSL